MRNSNKNLLNFLAFIALFVIAVLEIFSILSHFDVLTIGGKIVSLLNTIKNICICIVVGFTAYNFIANKSKGIKITYWVCLAIVIVCTVLIWF